MKKGFSSDTVWAHLSRLALGLQRLKHCLSQVAPRTNHHSLLRKISEQLLQTSLNMHRHLNVWDNGWNSFHGTIIMYFNISIFQYYFNIQYKSGPPQLGYLSPAQKSDPHLPFAEATRALGCCFGVTGSQILPILSLKVRMIPPFQSPDIVWNFWLSGCLRLNMKTTVAVAKRAGTEPHHWIHVQPYTPWMWIHSFYSFAKSYSSQIIRMPDTS